MTRHRLNRLVCLVLLAPACSADTSHNKSVRTQRERDSVIGASSLPGAGGVRGALGVNDSAAARNARLDSVANQR
jgi:hypothetical protein